MFVEVFMKHAYNAHAEYYGNLDFTWLKFLVYCNNSQQQVR